MAQNRRNPQTRPRRAASSSTREKPRPGYDSRPNVALGRAQSKKPRVPLGSLGLIAGGVAVLVLVVAGILLFSHVSKKGSAANAESSLGQKSVAATSTPAEPEDTNPYDGFYFYDAERQERYEKYAAKHDGLTAEEVVWQVGADIDQPDFAKAKKVTNPDSLTVLVNKHFKLSKDYEPSDMVTTAGDKQMTRPTYNHYKELSGAASKKGLSLTVMSAYRSYTYQTGVHQRYANRDGEAAADRFSARAGYSEHQTGRAIDLIVPGGKLMTFNGTPECTWVHKNAWKYGFIVRYPSDQTDITGYMYESWHITYVGEDVAKTMHDEKIATLEEYVVKYVDHQPPAR